MTEFFTIAVLAANIIVASAFARFATAQSLDADTFEGRVVARIRARDVRSAVAPDIGASTGAYWGSPLF
jgi:hypothetical protein